MCHQAQDLRKIDGPYSIACLLIHAIGIMISSDAGSQRWVAEAEGVSRVWNGPHTYSLKHPADPVDNLLEPTTQRLQTQMPIAFENEGLLLAGGCILSPRTIPFITEKQNSIVAMSTDFGAISGSKT